jgi:hypothetical protein
MADPLDPRVVLTRIIGVLGLTSLVGTGCAPRLAGDDGSEGADGSSSNDGAEDGSTSDTSGDSTDSGDSGDSADSGGLLPDLGGDLPPDGGGEPAECESIELFDSWPDPSFYIPDECKGEWGYDAVCFQLPEGASCAEVPIPELCLLTRYNCGLADMGETVSCGPFTVNDACCYVVTGVCPIGRPFMVAGVARVAALRPESSWASAPAPDLRSLDDATKAALADAYARDGLREHASVASFARFTTQLQALGAAPDLIAASLRASVDELRHAQRCFGLASAYAGSPIGPGPLDVRACLAASDLEAVALSLASEGCIAETVSMLLLAAARDRARDPAVRACLSEMLTDELEHVLLAWEALAALLRAHPQLRGPLARVFAEAEQQVGFGSITELPGDAASMRAHGYLSIEERRSIARDALAQVVRPAAHALLTTVRASSEQPAAGDDPIRQASA